MPLCDTGSTAAPVGSEQDASRPETVAARYQAELEASPGRSSLSTKVAVQQLDQGLKKFHEASDELKARYRAAHPAMDPPASSSPSPSSRRLTRTSTGSLAGNGKNRQGTRVEETSGGEHGTTLTSPDVAWFEKFVYMGPAGDSGLDGMFVDELLYHADQQDGRITMQPGGQIPSRNG